MRIHISKGNTKIGGVPNLSLTPGKSCVKDIPCFKDGCYAFHSYRRFKTAAANWDENLEFYQVDPAGFFAAFADWLHKHNPEKFRLFVGGDFPDKAFFKIFKAMCRAFPKTKFLVFTKRYDYDYSIIPFNLNIVLSTWPGHPLPKNRSLQWSWIEGDPRIAEHIDRVKAHRCPGKCDDCAHYCWEVDRNQDIIFPKH